jgi:DNA-binding response OmpR family regulator
LVTESTRATGRGPRHLLLIDPEAGFRRVLREQLEQDDAWRVDEIPTVEVALADPGGRPPPDLVVATVTGHAGRAAIGRWRRAGVTAPLVALVAPSGRDVAGASLTIRKPVRLTDLRGAIAGAAGPGGARGDGATRWIGPYRFEPAAKRLVERARVRTIRLTEKETAMLDLLWQAGGTVVPRDALLAHVWGYQAGISTHTLETHVYRLRRKIERDPAHAELLVTAGGGYRLVR